MILSKNLYIIDRTPYAMKVARMVWTDRNPFISEGIVRDSEIDKEVANPVKEEIAKLPAKDVVTLANKGAVTTARANFEKLTQTQKALVDNLAKLTDAEAKIAELQGAVDQAKQALTAKIAEVATAEKGKVEGEAVGNQVVGSKDTLDAAKVTAEGVLNNASSTTQQLTDATTTLNDAIEAYKVATVKELAGLNDIEITGTASDETNTVTLNAGETLAVISGTVENATVAVKDSSKVNVTGVKAGQSTITVKVTVGGHTVKVGTFKVTVK